MIFRLSNKLVIAALIGIGLLVFFQIQTASAGLDSQDGIYNLVDGGQFLEEHSPDDFNQKDDGVDFSDLDFPARGITPSSAAAVPPIRIMPLGDSITKGTGTCQEGNPPEPPDEIYWNCTGYRDYLWFSLTGSSYPVEFVGSQGTQFQDDYMNPYHDNDHEGHGGWKTSDIKNNIYGSGLNWLQNYPSEIVLLHIGTNDFSSLPLADPNTVATRVGQILDKIDDYESAEGKEVYVILAKIIKRYDSPDRTLAVENFNNALQTMANSRISGGDKIIVVDMETALTYPGDFFDDLHPNATGYEKMSVEWYEALAALLNLPPTLTNPGAQSSIQGQTIYLQMQANDPENDSLTYSATGLPAGLTINPNSGEISGKISNSILAGSVFQVIVTADDKTGFPDTDPYNKDQVTFTWKIGEQVVLPLVIR